MSKEKKIAFTTSIPVEVIYAAGYIPIDLNNIFINENPINQVRQAELAGFPRNICSWIKGMYTIIKNNDFDYIIGVVQGDCSNTHSLMNILKDENHKILSFSYPFEKEYIKLNNEIIQLESFFSIDRLATLETKLKLDKIRKKLIYLDELTWKTNQVSSLENHSWLVTSSDFCGDFLKYSDTLDCFINKVITREPFPKKIRLGYVGVPPILSDLYSFIEENNARIVYNEVQRQFGMFDLEEDIVKQYLKFTYPYSIFDRIEDIKKEIKLRNIDGLICYTQSFCHRQLDIISLKKHIDIPILVIEGDQPASLDARTKLRIESFIEMLNP